jgi:hypothetical protein
MLAKYEQFAAQHSTQKWKFSQPMLDGNNNHITFRLELDENVALEAAFYKLAERKGFKVCCSSCSSGHMCHMLHGVCCRLANSEIGTSGA